MSKHTVHVKSLSFLPRFLYIDLKQSMRAQDMHKKPVSMEVEMRRHYLDNIRWITVCLVVLYHVIYMYNSITVFGVIGPFRKVQYQDVLMYLLYPWFMVLLFIVAGMCSRYYLENHSVKAFVRARTRKLLVPSTIGLLVFGWIQGYFNMKISNAFDTLPETMPGMITYLIMALSGTGVLWFIQLLWFFSMILALIRKFERGKWYAHTAGWSVPVLTLLVLPVWLSGLVLNTPIISVYRFGLYGFTFFLGYFVFAHDEVVDRLSKYRFLFIPLSILTGILYVYLHFGDNYAIMPVVGSLSAVVFAWCTILAILGGMKIWGDRSNAVSTFLSKRSYGLYVFHYLPLSIAAYFMHKYTDLGPLSSYLIAGVTSYAGGLLLYEVISRIPVLRWCVLGERRKFESKLSNIESMSAKADRGYKNADSGKNG